MFWSHFQMPNSFLSILNLSEQEMSHPPATLAKLKTVHEWMSAAFDAVKENSDFSSMLQAISPWASAAFEAGKEALPPVKFVIKLFDELTKVQEPETLALIACTLAYQSAATKAIQESGGADAATRVRVAFSDTLPDSPADFASFTLEQAVSHPFVHHADRVAEFYCAQAGYNQSQLQQIVSRIHERFPDELAAIVSHGKSKERFDPLWRWLQLDVDGRSARAALRRHGEYLSWLFNEAPVLEHEPYALKHIYINTDIGHLTRAQIEEKSQDGRLKRDPFSEQEVCGGRKPLLETVLKYIRDPKFNEPIVIQGSAGSGKSSFTLQLAAKLNDDGLKPIRIRLRDVRIEKELFTALGEAVSLEDEIYLQTHDRWPAATNILQGGAIFRDEVPFNDMRICRYVLILDGWDEISIAVSEGFKQRVKELLMNLRRELFGRGPIVRIVLTGRPSDAIDDCADFFMPNTPVLTIRALTPTQLEQFAAKLRSALETQPVRPEEPSVWAMPSSEELREAFRRYRESRRDSGSGAHGATAVLGIPFLAQLAFRVVAGAQSEKYKVLDSETTLLRNLTDITVRDADRPSDRASRARVRQRITGEELRVLLRRMAAEMSIVGKESISRSELRKRLKTEDLDESLRSATKDHVLTALMVSFYFKGGNPALGCEFTHKALREYLYAEEIVESLKKYGRTSPPQLSEREPYWKDFDHSDPRHKLTRELANLLAPQWISYEVRGYVTELISWEIGRSVQEEGESGGASPALSRAQWRVVRDGLVDAWDWWCEGVHIRPQVKIDPETDKPGWVRSVSEKLIDRNVALEDIGRGDGGVPVRFTTLDSHLGEALFNLCVVVHDELAEYAAEAEELMLQARQRGSYQSRDEHIRFRPGGAQPDYFRFYSARISAAGWLRSFIGEGGFPAGVSLRRVDLRDVSFIACNLMGVDLENADLSRANFSGSVFERANLHGCNFTDAKLRFAYLAMTSGDPNLEGADTEGAIFDADIREGSTEGSTQRWRRMPRSEH
jgi:hypothetical protein